MDIGMKRVIIVGCRGSGKTSLAYVLHKSTGLNVIEYGNPIVVTKDENVLENFIESRNMYINYTISKLLEVSKNDEDSIIQIRGPETLYTYSVFSPIVNGHNWNMAEIMKDEFDNLRKYFSDYIIILDLQLSDIDKRCQHDNKVRYNMDFWKKLWFEYERPFFLSMKNAYVINSANLSVEDCCTEVISFLKDNGIC